MTYSGFTLKARLTGHVDGVNCIAFASKGETMASGGDDESVRIWSIKDQSCSQVLQDHAARWGPITALCWISDGLVIGTGRGQILIYELTTPSSTAKALFKEVFSNIMFPASVEAIAHDAENDRIAVTSHDGHIRVFECARRDDLKLIWENNILEMILRGAYFMKKNTTLAVFGLESGEITHFDVQSGKRKRTLLLKSGIGGVDLAVNGKTILVDNLRDGFDIYELDSPFPTRSFPIPSSTMIHRVKQGVFTEFLKFAICGSDHGKVYVFDIATSKKVEVLEHGKANTLVQTVQAFHDRGKGRTIVASADREKKAEICLWERNTFPNEHLTKKSGGPAEGMMAVIINMAVWVVLLLVLWKEGKKWGRDVVEQMMEWYAQVV